jgi:hypothetical protein
MQPLRKHRVCKSIKDSDLFIDYLKRGLSKLGLHPKTPCYELDNDGVSELKPMVIVQEMNAVVIDPILQEYDSVC